MIKEEYKYNLGELSSIIGEVFVVSPHEKLPAVAKPNGMLYEREDVYKMIETLKHYLNNMDSESIEEYNDELFDILNNEYLFDREKRVVDKSGYIYLLEAETGDTKIGRTKKLDDRMYHFTTKLPMDLKVIYYVKSEDSYNLERLLHEQHASKRTRGEWFNLTKEDIKDIQTQYKMNVY